jgi:hypothetical protein
LAVAIALLVVAGAAAVRAQVVCSPEILKAIRETGTGAEMAALDVAMARLTRIEHLVDEGVWDRVAKATVHVVDPNLGSATPITIHHWVQTTLRGTDEEIAAVINAVDRLRDVGGKPYLGLFLKSGIGDESSTWLINAASGNRGHLFEVVAAVSLIDEGFVDASKIVGFGVRVLDNGTLLIEGDLVERLASGGRRFIDFKAAGGGYTVERLAPAYQALLRGDVQEVVYAYESATAAFPPDAWLAEFNRLNVELRSRGLAPFRLKAAGTFP